MYFLPRKTFLYKAEYTLSTQDLRPGVFMAQKSFDICSSSVNFMKLVIPKLKTKSLIEKFTLEWVNCKLKSVIKSR